ncbi:1,6-anhydro-N-acetylmuramyl-L-alanine amidase AmpD [Salinisphaera sp. Q1T1-3]|uniref:1,6-anhydro-N-acetylmuramyl-L-alanine amidase AmpD n=1 Tax=Salinisphaera sp. Q1T1-3 TaxID=2321229 RepID=UPI000E70B8A4|nr:1,6-anhydro-N-acetylmuramyl-L-alanine amidase AmpD [Salinisphaera sp. Q1T1-3]RJS91584.1 1,6-anhydro-N-acetylmuramyl-L-alanine amidase AmpD [Salinisphaera sp. Q1T1-3]
MNLVIDDAGWLVGVSHRPSPNQDMRPAHVPIDALVVHGITLPPGRFGHGLVTELFTNTLDVHADPALRELADVRVSAHALIERTGRITQYASFDARAWHAGVSRLGGRSQVNDFAIGVELEGTDHCPYARAQYTALARLVRTLAARYPALVRERIVGHSDIAPGRKTDPGPAFDWTALDRVLARSASCI